jgi:hypothetical protein
MSQNSTQGLNFGARVEGPFILTEFPEEHVAAAKLQAYQRGRMVRQEMGQNHAAAAKLQAVHRGRKVRQQHAQSHQAATKLQAHFRGFKARRNPYAGAIAECEETGDTQRALQLLERMVDEGIEGVCV